MKNSNRFMIIATLIICSISCKKENSPAPAKTYGQVISGKTWQGLFAYTGATSEYYSVSFLPDSTLIWDQMLGQYAGSWSLADNHLTIRFNNQASAITADITDDNTLTNFTSGPSTIMLSESLVKNTAPGSLEGTIWEGSYLSSFGTLSVMEILFKNSQFTVYVDKVKTGDYSYARPSGQMFIASRLNDFNWFGLIVSDSSMKGTVVYPGNKWELTKQ